METNQINWASLSMAQAAQEFQNAFAGVAILPSREIYEALQDAEKTQALVMIEDADEYTVYRFNSFAGDKMAATVWAETSLTDIEFAD